MNYRVRAVRVKQHDGGGARTVHSERGRFGLGPRMDYVCQLRSYAPPLPMDKGRWLGNYWSRIKQDGYVADRTADRDWCPVIIHYPSLRIISDFDDDGLSARVYMRLPITRPLPQIED